jgi:hypothetical protein
LTPNIVDDQRVVAEVAAIVLELVLIIVRVVVLRLVVAVVLVVDYRRVYQSGGG